MLTGLGPQRASFVSCWLLWSPCHTAPASPRRVPGSSLTSPAAAACCPLWDVASVAPAGTCWLRGTRSRQRPVVCLDSGEQGCVPQRQPLDQQPPSGGPGRVGGQPQSAARLLSWGSGRAQSPDPSPTSEGPCARPWASRNLTCESGLLWVYRRLWCTWVLLSPPRHRWDPSHQWPSACHGWLSWPRHRGLGRWTSAAELTAASGCSRGSGQDGEAGGASPGRECGLPRLGMMPLQAQSWWRLDTFSVVGGGGDIDTEGGWGPDAAEVPTVHGPAPATENSPACAWGRLSLSSRPVCPTVFAPCL